MKDGAKKEVIIHAAAKAPVSVYSRDQNTGLNEF